MIMSLGQTITYGLEFKEENGNPYVQASLPDVEYRMNKISEDIDDPTAAPPKEETDSMAIIVIILSVIIVLLIIILVIVIVIDKNKKSTKKLPTKSGADKPTQNAPTIQPISSV